MSDLWQKMQSLVASQRLAQALLFTGQSNPALINQIIALYLCQEQASEPCRLCQNCLMIFSQEHPDVQWIKPEKAGASLKIDQIRPLQTLAYQTPQCAKARFFIIESAERMNKSVANALLKILEEPASFTHFILMAQHLGTILPTIVSRCQIWRFESTKSDSNFLIEVEEGLIQSVPAIINNLVQLKRQETIPTMVALEWKPYELPELLVLLYLIFAQTITLSVQNKKAQGPYAPELNQLLPLVTRETAFTQLRKIIVLRKKISQNITLNTTLVLEDLLMTV